MSYPDFDAARLQIALANSVYLAACVLLRRIPDTPVAAALREELAKARDAPRNERLTTSEHVSKMLTGRSNADPLPGAVALVYSPSGDELPRFAISFNRVFATSWPLDPIILGTSEARPLSG